MSEKEYALLKGGVSQMQDGKWIERKKGDLVTLSREAAEHLAAEGFIEDPKAKRTKTEATK